MRVRASPDAVAVACRRIVDKLQGFKVGRVVIVGHRSNTAELIGISAEVHDWTWCSGGGDCGSGSNSGRGRHLRKLS